jgi:hypothetical protein
MRTPEQIEKIKKDISDPYAIPGFLNRSEIEHLIRIFEGTSSHKSPYSPLIKKNTGPVTLNLNDFYSDPVISSIIEKLKVVIGNHEITAAFFFKTDYPHIIHNDDTFELPESVYKGITLPLMVYGGEIKQFPYLCFFDQFYFHGPSKFFKNETYIPTYYNKQIYNYSEVTDLRSSRFDQKIYDLYFTHLKKEWLEGLTLQSAIPWIPGNAIIFDSVRLHCASDFRKLGISSKLGISIFTKKEL